jgi:serine/threonine protein kinase
VAADDSGQFILLNRLADEFAERYRKGERPPLSEYIKRHPDLAAEIREFFPAMVEMEQVKEERLALSEPVATGPLPPLERLGDFRIIREIGRGGMGVVYEAEQVSLGRHVALKVLPRQLLIDSRTKRRFEREAKAAARLHHTNIVPVFGVGEHEGLPYYAMQYIQGTGLNVVIKELAALGSHPSGNEATAATIVWNAAHNRSGAAARAADASGLNSSVHLLGQSDASFASKESPKLTYWQSVARIGAQVAEALEYAHQQGVVHRDIKPSNLLLDLAGTVWVTDFGLAKADDHPNLTYTGDVLGTFRYMPPEAFEGRAGARRYLQHRPDSVRVARAAAGI